MEVQHLNTWNELTEAIAAIRQRYGSEDRKLPDGQKWIKKNQILFRGQSNHVWELDTTLERQTRSPFDVASYVSLATRCVNELESLTGKQWNLPSTPDLRNEIEITQDSHRVVLPCYEYLVYLRHHGFPSPLLDWTESPYIAAYFAFCDRTTADRVAMYAYVESPKGGKFKKGHSPTISVQGPFATTHARHFTQKAWYTVSTQWSSEHKRHQFCPHDKVFSTEHKTQDILVTLALPTSERRVALNHLNDYNINHFTLFQSEDSLVRSLAIKNFDLEYP